MTWETEHNLRSRIVQLESRVDALEAQIKQITPVGPKPIDEFGLTKEQIVQKLEAMIAFLVGKK